MAAQRNPMDGCPQATAATRAHYAHLMSLPAQRDGRPEAVYLLRGLTGDQRRARAEKFLTLADEYAKRRTFAREQAKPPHTPPRGFFTVQRAQRPLAHFSNLDAAWAGRDTAAYVRMFERNAGLVNDEVMAERREAQVREEAEQKRWRRSA
jgi:hypothetical protein